MVLFLKKFGTKLNKKNIGTKLNKNNEYRD